MSLITYTQTDSDIANAMYQHFQNLYSQCLGYLSTFHLFFGMNLQDHWQNSNSYSDIAIDIPRSMVHVATAISESVSAYKIPKKFFWPLYEAYFY